MPRVELNPDLTLHMCIYGYNESVGTVIRHTQCLAVTDGTRRDGSCRPVI